MSHHHHCFDPANLSRLDDPARLNLFDPVDLFATSGLSAGHTVIDLGTGSGFYLPFLSRAVGPHGRVIGLDLEPKAIAHALKKSEIAALPNLELKAIDLPPAPLPLADSTIDLAFLGFVFHELEPLDAVLLDLKRVLKPGGRLLLVEWSRCERDKGPPADHVPSLADSLIALSRAGFLGPRVRDYPPYCSAIAAHIA